MRSAASSLTARGRHYWLIPAACLIGFGAWQIRAAQDTSGFPEGYDAVLAAPASHKVIFENELVRVLEVTIPPTGSTEPMHHHRWPGFFLGWDTGGKSSHIRYHTPAGPTRDVPSENDPVVPGHWTVQWMKAEPMHAIEAVENTTPPNDPPLIRVEIKLSR
jgi:hypothetical protein